MISLRLWLKILVMALVFGMTVVGCRNNSTDGNGGTDIALNGTWIQSINGIDTGETTLKNGNYNYISYKGDMEIGIYIVNGKFITFTRNVLNHMVDNKTYTAIYYPENDIWVTKEGATFRRKKER